MLITKKNLQNEISHWRRSYPRFHRELFCENVSSNAVMQLASAALQAGKTAAKDIGMKAIDVGKTIAFDSDKKLVGKAAKKLSTIKSQVANAMVPQEEIAKKLNEVIAIPIQDLVRRLNGSCLK